VEKSWESELRRRGLKWEDVIMLNTTWLYTDAAVWEYGGTGRQQCQSIVPIAIYTVKKCSWEWANLSPETWWADLKSLIGEKLLNLVGCLHRCSLLVSVSQSVRGPHGTHRLLLDGISWNLTFDYFSKIRRENLSFIKTGQAGRALYFSPNSS